MTTIFIFNKQVWEPNERATVSHGAHVSEKTFRIKALFIASLRGVTGQHLSVWSSECAVFTHDLNHSSLPQQRWRRYLMWRPGAEILCSQHSFFSHTPSLSTPALIFIHNDLHGQRWRMRVWVAVLLALSQHFLPWCAVIITLSVLNAYCVNVQCSCQHKQNIEGFFHHQTLSKCIQYGLGWKSSLTEGRMLGEMYRVRQWHRTSCAGSCKRSQTLIRKRH